jgi:DNA polymerase-3 subunit gamma/tau
MLSQGAFNALLKTLEEPPAHVVFILATTEPNKIPLTILSRCQRFDFQAISETDMVERLKDVISKENLSVTDEALHLVASLSEGGMRDALSLLDQSISYSKDQNITVDDILAVSGNVSDKYILELLKKIKENEASNALDILNRVLDSGKEISKVISDIMFFLRNVLIFKINKIESTKEIYKDSDYITYANAIDNSLIYKYLNLLNETLNNIKYTNQKRAFLEICIIKMADNQKTQDINSLLRRIDQLERKVEHLSMLKSNNTEPVFPDQDYNLPSYEEIDHSNITYDNSKCIEVGEINDIINNGDKNIRNNVISILPQLIDINPLLQDVKCVCTSKESAIFTLDSEGMSNRMMKDPMYTEVLEFFKKDFDFKNVYFINQSMWDELLADWMDKYKAGNKSPILDNHDIRILKYVKENDENINSKDSIDELFDEDLIKEE